MRRTITIDIPLSDSDGHLAGVLQRYLDGDSDPTETIAAREIVAAARNALRYGGLRSERERDEDLWHVQVHVTRQVDQDGWKGMAHRDLPTFVLDGAILGIAHSDEAAAYVADIMCIDVDEHKDWEFVATIRRGGSHVVNSRNLRADALTPLRPGAGAIEGIEAP